MPLSLEACPCPYRQCSSHMQWATRSSCAGRCTSFLPAVTTAQFFFVAVTTAHAWPPCCSVVVAISAQFCGSSFCATVRVTGTVTSTATATFPWEPTYKKNENWGKKSDHSPLTPISSYLPLRKALFGILRYHWGTLWSSPGSGSRECVHP